MASCRRCHRCGGIDSSSCAMWQQAGMLNMWQAGRHAEYVAGRHARVGARRANVQSACFIVNSCQQQKLTIATKSCAHATRIPLAFVALKFFFHLAKSIKPKNIYRRLDTTLQQDGKERAGKKSGQASIAKSSTEHVPHARGIDANQHQQCKRK